MAKKNKTAGDNVDINAAIKKSKKKMTIIVGVLMIGVFGVGGFIGYNVSIENSVKKADEQNELSKLALKDYPMDEAESAKIHTRDITKQTYVLKDGAILFEGTIVFHNKLCANLYNGITDRQEQLATEPDSSVEDMFGDKLAKDALNRYLQTTNKATLKSTEVLAEGLKHAINEQFKNTFGHEVVKNILVTNNIVQ